MQATLIQPLITEKSTRLGNQNWYVFRVNKGSSKQAIAKAVTQEFKVHVVDIKTVMMHGKKKRAGKKRLLTKSSGFKKAFVKLKKDEKIELFGFGNKK